MSSNCLVFHTSGGISSGPATFVLLIFLSTVSSSSCVNSPSLMSNCLLIILVTGSCVTFGGFPSKFSKCCFHRCIRSGCLVTFSLAFAVLFLLLTSFTVCHAILDCLSSTESLILSIWFWTIHLIIVNTNNLPLYGLKHSNGIWIIFKQIYLTNRWDRKMSDKGLLHST